MFQRQRSIAKFVVTGYWRCRVFSVNSVTRPRVVAAVTKCGLPACIVAKQSTSAGAVSDEKLAAAGMAATRNGFPKFLDAQFVAHGDYPFGLTARGLALGRGFGVLGVP